MLLFAGLNLVAAVCFVICFTLFPILATRPSKFVILYVSCLEWSSVSRGRRFRGGLSSASSVRLPTPALALPRRPTAASGWLAAERCPCEHGSHLLLLQSRMACTSILHSRCRPCIAISFSIGGDVTSLMAGGFVPRVLGREVPAWRTPGRGRGRALEEC